MTTTAFFNRRRSANTIRYSITVLLALLFIFPLLYLVSGTLMTLDAVSVYPPKLLPPSLHFQNFKDALDVMTPRIFLNSFIFTFGILILQLIISFTAGFAF